MAVIRPFRALRPRPELAGAIAAPPYDVLSSDEARELVRGNPDSFLRVNKPEIDFPRGTDVYSDQVYQRGKENFDRLVNEGLMVRDGTPCFYVYRLTWSGQSQTGLVALTSVEEYEQGKIKKHEFTRPEKVNDRANHILKLNAQVGPVLSIFRHSPEISALLTGLTAPPPHLDFAADNVRHELWVADKPEDIATLEAAFARLPHLYIADGHHRSQSAWEVCRRKKEGNPHHTGKELYNFFLNALFDEKELRILPYNRVVADLNGLECEAFVRRAADKFHVLEADNDPAPRKPLEFGVYCEKKWYRFEAREGSFDRNNAARSLDSAILTANILDPILGITDIRTDQRIDFVGGIRGTRELVRLVDSGEYKIAFSLYPVSVEQLLKVADAGEIMPPKSTWFEPKLRSGMVVNSLEEE
ncbi:MAG: DUF1015 family protein [candidate division Zixibacteria bacterium]|nr:DUF1015 family protein [candidate division Zixibacteria bacterium]